MAEGKNELYLEKMKINERLSIVETRMTELITTVKLQHESTVDLIKSNRMWIEKINKIIVGNGEAGLAEKTNANTHRLNAWSKRFWAFLAAILTLAGKAIYDVVTEILHHGIHGQ